MNQSLEEILKEFKLAGERYNLPAKVVLMLSGSVHRAFEAGQKSTAREIYDFVEAESGKTGRREILEFVKKYLGE